MDISISVEKLHEQSSDSEKVTDPVKALDIVEVLRLQSGKFLYEYPTRFRRVIEVVRKDNLIRNKKASSRGQELADLEKLES